MDASPLVQLLLALAILIAAAEILGVFTRMIGQPRVFGSLMAGVIIGPSLLNFLNWPVFTPEAHDFIVEGIEILAEMGVMFLMFNVGLEVHLSELLSVGRAAVAGGTLGALVPTVAATLFVMAYGYSLEIALFVGVALAATSVSISAQTLIELKVLKSKEGNTVLASAIVDDILAILLLSFVIATVASHDETHPSLVVIAIKMVVYISVVTAVSWYFISRIICWLGKHEHTNHLVTPLAIVAALIFGWSAEALGGVAAITGAFIAGVGLSRTSGEINLRIKSASSNITYALLAPIFFASVGLHINLRDFPTEAILFTVLLLALAIITKIGGCGIGARLAGTLTNRESMRVGVCMVSRGEVGLIILNEGLLRGIFTHAGYVEPAVLIVVLLTTMLTPPMVRWAFH